MKCTTMNVPVTSSPNLSPRANRRHRGNHDEPEFSNQSIMNAMEKFVSTVQEMDETILVPCRLMDLKVGDSSDKIVEGEAKSEIHSMLNHADLYSLYTMVNAVKNELLWGQNSTPSGEPSNLFVPGVINGTNYIPSGVTSLPPSHSSPNCINYSSLPEIKTHSRNSSASNIKPEKQIHQNHQRRPSTGSLISTHSLTSVSLSDTDSETGNENDSGIEDANQVDPTLQIALNFRRHLNGLYKSLEQMTSAASYLTQRYQHDVGGNV